MNQTKLLVLKFKELCFFLINPESKLSENLADTVCGASYKFCWATCCAFPSFEQQGWTRSPEVPFPDSVLTNLQEKVGVVFCKDRPAENKFELVLWAWGLCYHAEEKELHSEQIASLWFPQRPALESVELLKAAFTDKPPLVSAGMSCPSVMND